MAPEAHVELYARMQAAAPFELLQPQHSAASGAWRARQEFVEKDGRPFRHDRETDEWVPLDQAAVSGHASDYHANEERWVFSKADVDARVTVTPAAQQIAAKQRVLAENFERIGKVTPREWLEPLTDQPWGYRRKGRLSV